MESFWLTNKLRDFVLTNKTSQKNEEAKISFRFYFAQQSLLLSVRSLFSSFFSFHISIFCICQVISQKEKAIYCAPYAPFPQINV